MGLIHFQPARSSKVPEIREFPVESSATIALGAPLQRDGTNTDEVEEHAGGDTVTGIIGVALQGATAGTPDFGEKIQVAIASEDQEFLGQIRDSGGSTWPTITNDGTYEGNEYGIIEVNGNWFIDEDDTTDVVVRVTKELPGIGGSGAVLFKFIPTAIGQ